MYIKAWKKILLVSTLALLGTILEKSAIAQNTNFVDINQSRQFFDERRRNSQREQNNFRNKKPQSENELPQDYQQPPSLNNSNYSFQNLHKLKPLSRKLERSNRD